MGTPVNQRVQKRRDALRAQGLRLVQRWVVDTRTPEFLAEARRQSRILTEAARTAPDEIEVMNELDRAFDEALRELDREEAAAERKAGK